MNCSVPTAGKPSNIMKRALIAMAASELFGVLVPLVGAFHHSHSLVHIHAPRTAPTTWVLDERYADGGVEFKDHGVSGDPQKNKESVCEENLSPAPLDPTAVAAFAAYGGDAMGGIPQLPGRARRLQQFPALVLNGDYTPLSYAPLSLWSWQDAIKAVFAGRVVVVAAYDAVVRAPNCEIQVPSVIALKTYVKQSKLKPAFTRKNVFIRDEYTCQYCGQVAETSRVLTFDHVKPRSKGGPTSWDNVVACCQPCNNRKGDLSLKKAGKLLDMNLRTFPREPSFHELQAKARARTFPHQQASSFKKQHRSHSPNGGLSALEDGSHPDIRRSLGATGSSYHSTWDDFLGP